MNRRSNDRFSPDARSAAEKAFKAATTKKADLPPERPAIPVGKEMVSLRLDRDVLDVFQADGPGWQDRINDTLRAAMESDEGHLTHSREPRIDPGPCS